MPDRCPPAALQPAAAGLDQPDPVTMLSRLCRTAEREISLMVRAATYVRLRPQITELSRERDLMVRAVVHRGTPADGLEQDDHHHDHDDRHPRDHGREHDHDDHHLGHDHGDGSGHQGSPSRMITTARALDRELVLIDRRRAVVVEQMQMSASHRSGQPGQPGPRGLVVTEPLAVRALHDLVLSSAGLDRSLASEREQCPLNEPDVTADDIEVLHCLAAGTPDERAADQLGLSVRTYRRRLARLMQTLRVQTRFQAALQARDSRLI